MNHTRRAILIAPMLLPFAASEAFAEQDPRLTERATGSSDAPITVIEYFSMTCPHCARFHRDVFPQINRALIKTGRIRLVWRDFPLDRLALAASAVARTLPSERYEPFMGALLASLDKWTARGSDNMAEIAKYAALAGLSRAQFDAATTDQALLKGIVEMRSEGEKKYRVNSTPTFLFGDVSKAGELDYATFAKFAADPKA